MIFQANRPFFFLVGAQKAATSTLDAMLEQHPGIFMPAVKEPNYVVSQFLKGPFGGPGDDRVAAASIRSKEAYDKLYADALPEQIAGDASTSNLYYWRRAIPQIKEQFGDVPIIICLRNPVDRAYSAYMHLRRDLRETLSFEDALEQEPLRHEQNWSFIWFYRDAGYYAAAVRAYLENFSRVKVLLFEQICSNPIATAQACYEFLGVDSGFVPELKSAVNSSGEPKHAWVQKMLFAPGPVKHAFFRVLSRLIPDRTLYDWMGRLRNMNLQRRAIDPSLRRRLQEEFLDDIQSLDNLIEQDLSAWHQTDADRK